MQFQEILQRVWWRLRGRHPVRLSWSLKLFFLRLFSRKIKIGFGPLTSGEDDLAERKWRIDPIVDAINREKTPYTAGYFLFPSQMKQFDIVILVKKINPEFVFWMEKFPEKKYVYDIVDNPNDEEKYRYYFRSLPGFFEKLDGCILSSPVHKPWMRQSKKPSLLIEHPALNCVHKTRYENEKELRLLAQGYFANLEPLRWLEPFLPSLSRRVGRPVILCYHSEVVLEESEFVRYLRWTKENCFSTMVEADIGIAYKDLSKLHQYTKPSTKAIAYMAAGLPLICRPTAADREVVEHRITGLFAYGQKDFLYWIEKLARAPSWRRQLGRAARKKAAAAYSIDSILKKYLLFLDSLP